jgi:hypothetical protein
VCSRNTSGAVTTGSFIGVRRAERDAAGEPSAIVEYQDGREAQRTQYEIVDGKRTTVEEKFHDNGKLFVRRRKDAVGNEVYEAYWSADGALREETVTEFDRKREIVVRRERGHGGVLLFEARSDGKGLLCELYSANGKPSATGRISENTIKGVWQFFDESGSLRRKANLSKQNVEGSHRTNRSLTSSVSRSCITCMTTTRCLRSSRPSARSTGRLSTARSTRSTTTTTTTTTTTMGTASGRFPCISAASFRRSHWRGSPRSPGSRPRRCIRGRSTRRHSAQFPSWCALSPIRRRIRAGLIPHLPPLAKQPT